MGGAAGISVPCVIGSPAATFVTQSPLHIPAAATGTTRPDPVHAETAWFVNAGPWTDRVRRTTSPVRTPPKATIVAAPVDHGEAGAETDWTPIIDPDEIVLNYSAKYREAIAARMAQITEQRRLLVQPTPPFSLGGTILTEFPQLPSMETLTAHCAALHADGEDVDVPTYYLAMIPTTEPLRISTSGARISATGAPGVGVSDSDPGAASTASGRISTSGAPGAASTASGRISTSGAPGAASTASGRIRAHQFAAWAALLAIETENPAVQSAWRTAADRIAALAEAEAPPARCAPDRVFYGVIADWWPATIAHGEPHPIRKAWDLYLAHLDVLSSIEEAPPQKLWRRLAELAQGITKILSHEGVDRARSLAALQRRNVEFFDGLGAPQLVAEARRRRDAFAEQAGELASYYFAAEARLRREDRSIEHRLLKPLGHIWERMARASLIGTSPEAMAATQAQIAALETAEQRLAAWGGTIPPDRLGEWGLRRFLPIPWQQLVEAYFTPGIRPALIGAKQQWAAIYQRYTDWVAGQPDTRREIMASDPCAMMFYNLTNNWDHCVQALQSGAVKTAQWYERAARASETALTWLDGRTIDRTTASTQKYWHTLFGIQQAWFKAAEALAADQELTANTWAEAAGAMERLAHAWNKQGGALMEQAQSDLYLDALYGAIITWEETAKFTAEGLWDRAIIARRLAITDEQWAERLQQRGYTTGKKEIDERTDPLFQLILALYNTIRVYDNPAAREAWKKRAEQMEDNAHWYDAHSVDGRLPEEHEAEWKHKLQDALTEWKRLIRQFPPPRAANRTNGL
ncbi:MAG: hypothetical protein HY543_01000 [Deltaproteobacteria bacterium]|nr:hypothetical protein [Deltaproteobacteria bacterium]